MHRTKRARRLAKKSAHVTHAMSHPRRPVLKTVAFVFALLLFSAAPASAAVASSSGSAPAETLLGSLLAGTAALGAVKELAEKRRKAVEAIEAIEKKATDESRDLTDEENGQIDQRLAEIEDLDTQLDAAEDAEKRSARLKKARSRASSPAAPPPRGPEPNSEDRNDPVSNPDPQKYSLLRAIRCMADRKPLDGYEGEISQEIAHRRGKDPQGFFMPLSLRAQQPGAEQRDFDTTAATGALVDTTRPQMIQLLRNRTRIVGLGATLLNDLVGTIDIPKQSAAGTAYWVAEGAAPTESNQTVGQVQLTPSTLGAFTDYTRRTINQTSLDVENLIRTDLARVLAIELDRAAINGSGTGSEPEGILQNSSIETVAVGTNGGPLTHALAVQLETECAVDNADENALSYLTNAKVRGDAKTIERASGTARFIMADDGTINGYNVAVSNQVPSNLTKGASGAVCSALIFGDFSTVLMGFWSGVDVMVDPYALSTSGGVRIVLLQDTAIKFRHDESLKKIADLTTTA